MAISSVNITRISHNLRAMTLLDQLRKNTLELFQQQQRLVTGNKFLAPSEDPAAAQRAIRLTELLEQQAQVLDNIRYADGFLSLTDSTIGEIGDLLIEARDIASESLNLAGDPLDEQQQAEWESAAQLISSIIDALVNVGNRQFQDVYIFGGRRTTTAPFVQDLGGVLFEGDTGQLRSRVELLSEYPFGLTGEKLFGALSSEVKGWRDLAPALTTSMRLRDLDGALNRGVRLGQIQIDDTSASGPVSVDLTTADRIGDVADLINDALATAGSTTTVSVGTSGLQITVQGGESVTISDVGSGQTAIDLGIAGTFAPPAGPAGVFDGLDVNARLTLTTPLSALNDGAGINLAGGVQITNGDALSQPTVVEFTGATTIQDVLNALNGAGVGVLARINDAGTGIDVVSRVSGQELRIGENGGSAAEALGIRSFWRDTRLSELNGGEGVETVTGDDLRVYTTDNNVYFDVDLSSAQTIQDVIDLINAAAAAAGLSVGAVPPNDFVADLTDTGNGIRLTDNVGGADTLRLEKLNLSPALDHLGLSGKVGSGAGPVTLVSDDTHPVSPDGIFSQLIKLRDGLMAGDRSAVTQAGERIGELLTGVNRWQGVVGAQARGMSERLTRTEDAVNATRQMLSEVKDSDYTEAVTKFQQAQTALQASIMTGSQLMNLSLLEFLR